MAKRRSKRAYRKGPKTPLEKLNEISPGFVDSVMSAKNEELKNLIVKLELQDKEMEEAMGKDTDLQARIAGVKAAREHAKVAKETYSIPLTANRLKRRFCAQLLEERGKASSDEVVK